MECYIQGLQPCESTIKPKLQSQIARGHEPQRGRDNQNRLIICYCSFLFNYRGCMALGSSNTIGMALWGTQNKSILMMNKKRLSVY